MFRIKAMLVFMCLFLFALAETYSQTVMPIIKNCTTLGQEQFLSCERTLPNGEVQRARGACVCRNLGGMWDWQGGMYLVVHYVYGEECLGANQNMYYAN